MELRASWARIEEAIAGSNLHSTIVPLRQTVDCADGALLIYSRVTGSNLAPQEVRARFKALSLIERIGAVLAASEALAAICEAGFTIVDWYDGNLIYDFDRKHLWLCDWELCREGASLKLMAPEEFVHSSRIDQTTTVFNLGRYILLTVPELAEPLAAILARATYPARSGRFRTVREFVTAFRISITQDSLSTGSCDVV